MVLNANSTIAEKNPQKLHLLKLTHNVMIFMHTHMHAHTLTHTDTHNVK